MKTAIGDLTEPNRRHLSAMACHVSDLYQPVRVKNARGGKEKLDETMGRPELPVLCILGKMEKRPGLTLVCIRYCLVFLSM